MRPIVVASGCIDALFLAVQTWRHREKMLFHTQKALALTGLHGVVGRYFVVFNALEVSWDLESGLPSVSHRWERIQDSHTIVFVVLLLTTGGNGPPRHRALAQPRQLIAPPCISRG